MYLLYYARVGFCSFIFTYFLWWIFLASLSLDWNQANAIRSKVDAPFQNWDHINDYEKLFKSYNYWKVEIKIVFFFPHIFSWHIFLLLYSLDCNKINASRSIVVAPFKNSGHNCNKPNLLFTFFRKQGSYFFNFVLQT